MVPIMKDLIGNQVNFNDSLPLMKDNCKNNTEYSFYDPDSNMSIVFPCEVIYSGSDAITNYGIKAFLNKIYYDEYSCGFWSCLSENPFVLISQKAKDYWKSQYYYFLIGSVILIILGFVLIENKLNFPIILGGILILSAFPLRWLGLLFSFLFSSDYKGLFLTLVSRASDIFYLFLFVGIFLIVAGLAFRIFGASFVKKKFSRQEVKDIVKKSIEDSKKAEKQQVKKEKPKVVKKKK